MRAATPRRRLLAALALALALAPALLARAAFTSGNLLVSLAGDGTPAGDANSTLAQSLCALSFEEFAASGAALASTAQKAAVNSTGATAFTTLGNVADPSTNAPFSGALALSSDGFFVTFVGYGAPAGTPVGASNAGVGDTQTNNVIVAPPASASRLIGYIDYSGLVSYVQGNLDSISTVPSVANNMDVWGAVWCASCGGFYVTVGPYIGTASGGIFWIPSAPGIAGPIGLPVRLTSSPATSAATNLKQYNMIGIVDGVAYVARSGNGNSGGTNTLASPGQPGLPTTAAQVPLGSSGGNLKPVVGTVAAGISTTTLGSHLPHAFLFTGSGASLTFWQSDSVFGLLSVPGCNATATGTPVTCGGATVPTGTYTTFPPGTSLAKLNAKIMGIAAAVVGGQQVVVVLQIGAMWLWPVSNTGSYNSSSGSCCADPGAGACCWANGNAPIAPRAGFNFRYVAPVPVQMPCSLPGYYCPAPAGLPVPCPAGSACAGGSAPPALCSPGYFALAGAASCSACPSGLSTAAPGASASATCVPCAANFVPAVLPATGSTAPGCVACAAGLTSLPGAVSCASPSANAFTPGNLLIFMAGDGTVAGSAMPSAQGANDRGSVSAVAGSIVEYAVSASGALSPTGKSTALPSTGTSAPPGGPITVLGNVADVGNSGNASFPFPTSYQPFSGQLSTSTDGTIVSFVGYSQAAGAAVGASCMCNGAVAAANNNVGLTIAVPPPSVKRVIGWFDASGIAQIVNGDLNAVLGSVQVNSALWFANGAGQSGFYVTGGNTGATSSAALGGIYWIPMPQGIGGPMGAAVLICLNPSYTASNFKMYSAVLAYAGYLYAMRVTAGTSGGGGALPIAFPTTTQSACSTGTTLTQINGAGTKNAQQNGGWAQHAMVWTTSSDPAQPPVSYWHVDGESGLTRYTNCTGQPLICSNYSVGVGGAYITTPPLPLVSNNSVLVGLISGISAMVGGVPVIIVNTISGVWMWPTANTGAFNTSVGTCCAVPTAGACCWLNNNQPVFTAVPANLGMRGLALAPQQPTCATPGYACSLVGGALTLPAQPCVPGSFCPGGAAAAHGGMHITAVA